MMMSDTDGIDASLRLQGLCLKEEWIHKQVGTRRMSTERERDVATQFVFQRAMFADFDFISAGCLPPNLDQLHDIYLKGPFIVQFDEMFNIAGTTEKRCVDGAGRMLKIYATDGPQKVTCLEHQPIPALSAASPQAGIKVCLVNVFVRRGILMLSSDNTRVLGGSVAILTKAKLSLSTSADSALSFPKAKDNTRATTKTNATGSVMTATSTLSSKQPIPPIGNEREISTVSVTSSVMSSANRYPPEPKKQQQKHPPPSRHSTGSSEMFPFRPPSAVVRERFSTNTPAPAPAPAGVGCAVSSNDQNYMDFDEEALMCGSGVSAEQRNGKNGNDDIEEMYGDEFEMMDDFMPPDSDVSVKKGHETHSSMSVSNNDSEEIEKALGTVSHKRRGEVSHQSIVRPRVTRIIDMTDYDDKDDICFENGMTNSHVVPPSPSVNGRNLESRLRTSDVVNLENLRDISEGAQLADGGRSAHVPKATASSIKNIATSPSDRSSLSETTTSGTNIKKSEVSMNVNEIAGSRMISSPPGIAHFGGAPVYTNPLHAQDTFSLQPQESTGTPAASVSPLTDIGDRSIPALNAGRHRVYFSDILQRGVEGTAPEVCRVGYVEGNATSIKKFSVVEKKVEVPFFLTKLEFSDGCTSRDIKISSHLCEHFLQMSAQRYVELRENYLKSNKLDKKEGGNKFKRDIVSKFEHFSGRYTVAFDEGELILQDILGQSL